MAIDAVIRNVEPNEMDCPNFETCGGDLQFTVHAEYDGADEWTAFRGYSAECTEKTCACELTDEQWTVLERQAAEEWSEPEPDF